MGQCLHFGGKDVSVVYSINASNSSYKILCGFGPRANYADRVTAAFWRNSDNFCGYRMLRGQRNGFPRSLISIFSTVAATFSSK
jgi:hypothetical protein